MMPLEENDRALVFIQARMSSTRLPGKSLLPIGGLPLVVLAAKRAGNRGHKVTVLTSKDGSDDPLCAVLKKFGIEHYRGDLKDVRSRFVDVLEGADRAQVVIRLTGDNCLPDGTLLDTLEQSFCQQDLRYMGCTEPETGLPMGLAAEIFRVGDLLDSLDWDRSDAAREHVTVPLRARYGASQLKTFSHLDLSRLRVTIDTVFDYRLMAKAVSRHKDPVQESFQEIVQTVQGIALDSASKLVLGGAQFGLDYGITNESGKLRRTDAGQILKEARLAKVSCIDTAQAYGDSEDVLADLLAGAEDRIAICSKIEPLCRPDGPLNRPDASSIEALVTRSVDKFAGPITLLAHRWADFEFLAEAFEKAVTDGRLANAGASIQTPQELQHALRDHRVGHVQLPFNLLDRRWLECVDDIISAKRARPLTVHTRSALLQGLLAVPDKVDWPCAPALAEQLVPTLFELASELGFSSVRELALAYARSPDWIDGVVVGVSSIVEFASNLAAFDDRTLTDEEVQLIHTRIKEVPEDLVDPSKW